MKIILFLHEFVVSGTSINAIELAVKLRDLRGHDLILFASPGPLSRVAQQSGLKWIPAPSARMHPYLPKMRALRSLVKRTALGSTPEILSRWTFSRIGLGTSVNVLRIRSRTCVLLRPMEFVLR